MIDGGGNIAYGIFGIMTPLERGAELAHRQKRMTVSMSPTVYHLRNFSRAAVIMAPAPLLAVIGVGVPDLVEASMTEMRLRSKMAASCLGYSFALPNELLRWDCRFD